MGLRVSPEKYYIPQERSGQKSSPDVLVRQRLIDKLHNNLPGKGSVIHADLGLGKTTLMRTWLQQITPEYVPANAWLTLDETDNDPVRFLVGLAEALSRALPGLGQGAVVELGAPAMPNVQAVIANLLREIVAADTPLRIVLDQYETINTPRLHQAVAFLAANLPPFTHLVLAAGRDPLPDELARQLDGPGWVHIHEHELIFTQSEIEAFFQLIPGLKLSTEQLTLLSHVTHGEAYPLQLAALALKNNPAPAAFWEGLENRQQPPIDFLFESALQRQMDPVQEFLLCTSILDDLTGEACDDVLRASPSSLQAPGRSQVSLEHLTRNGVFTYRMGSSDQKSYRYHPLFAAQLRQRLMQLYPAHVPRMYQRASRWFEKAGCFEAAMHYALKTQDEGRAADILEENILDLIGSGQFTTTLNWLGKLNAGLVLLRPWLCLGEAWTVSQEGWKQGVEVLLGAVETASLGMPVADSQRANGHIAALRALTAYENKDFLHYEENLRKALELLPPEDGKVRCYTATLLGISQRDRGKFLSAGEAFTEAVACSQRSGAHSAGQGAASGATQAATSLALCRLADLHLLEGRLQKTLALCEEALFLSQDYEKTNGRPLFTAGLAHYFAGLALYERDDLDLSQGHAEQAVAISLAVGAYENAALAYSLLATTQTGRGGLSLAQTSARQARDMLSKLPDLPKSETQPGWHGLLGVRPALAEARLADLQVIWGEIEAADQWARSYRLSAEDWFDFIQGPLYLTLGNLLLAQNRLFEARRLARRLIQVFETAGAANGLLRAFLFQALVMRYTNDHTGVLQSMQRALQLAEFEHIIRPFLDYGSEIQALVDLCVERGIMINFAKTLQSAYTRQARRAASGSTLILVPTRPLTRPLPTTDGLSGEPLTDREKEVLRLLENYLTTVEIALRLEISDRTADTIVRNICRKLGVREPGQAVMRAHDLNII